MSTPYAGPPQGHYPPPPPPRPRQQRSHTGLIVLATVGGVLFVMFAGCVALVASVDGGASEPVAASSPTRPHGAAGAGEPDAPSGPGEQDSTPPKPKAAEIGDPVKVGKLRVTVTEVRTGLASIGPEVFDQHPDGQYVVLHLTVKNVGTEPEFFNSAGPAVYDDEGRQYHSTSVILGEEGGELFGEINPGNSTKGRLVFDVPKNVEPDRLELPGGFLDEPATVNLR